jgi:putative peptidoglycan lipid II flippase
MAFAGARISTLKELRNIASVSLPTIGSRVLGLARDILLFASLGAGVWSSAFVLAFTLPNLFRRLLGEGALTSAFIPVFSGALERDGKAGAFDFFNRVFFRMCLILGLLILLGALLLKGLTFSGVLGDRWAMSANLAVWLLPYTFFICLAALVTAALNVLGRFFVAASTPIFLNLCMIGSLLLGLQYAEDAAGIVAFLCGGVLLGGLLQLTLPLMDLKRAGWRPRPVQASGEAMGELWHLLLPGLLGAAVLQVNILISRLLAYGLNEGAAAVLYMSGRLMELPLGVFIFAVATVFFPQMARARSAGKKEVYRERFLSGMTLVLAVSIPAGIGLALLAKPILVALFEWRAFGANEVLRTAPLVAIYGLGLPFYSVATFATRGLHADKEMRAPVRVAVICLFANLALALSLMFWLGEKGLALANISAALVQAVLLLRILKDRHPDLDFRSLMLPFFKILTAGLGMGLFCGFLLTGIEGLGLEPKLASLLVVFGLVPAGVVIYGFCLMALRFEGMEELVQLFRRVLKQAD